MRKLFYVFGITLLLIGCKTAKIGGNVGGLTNNETPRAKQELLNDPRYTTDETYGYTAENPIMVGGGMNGPIHERRFLDTLAGPNGERIRYSRKGSCCMFKTENALFGGEMGLLDMYEIKYRGLKTPIILYLNMYDLDILKVPVGFTLRK